MTIVSLIISVLATIAAIVASFRSLKWAPAASWCGLAVLIIAPVWAPSWGTLLFWGIAAAIATGIGFLLPPAVSEARNGVAYMTAGALAGTFAGMAMSAQAPMIIGAILGVIFGIVAFSRTPAGKSLGFPSSRFMNYACAKGFPIVITACECGLTALYASMIIQSL